MPPAPRRLHVAARRRPGAVQADDIEFGWRCPSAIATQTAYEIAVLDEPNEDPTDPPVWHSGVVETDATTVIPYSGRELDQRARYWWTVRCRTGRGEWTEWADPASFETSVESWEGEWLAPAGPAYTDAPAPVPAFRRSFTARSQFGAIESARLDLAVGGTAVVEINGDRVGDRWLDPQFTDYEERTLASTYDVTDQLIEGSNAISIRCGRERYSMTAENPWGWTETPWQRPHPELLAELTIRYVDGTEQRIVTDDQWRVTPTGTTFDCLYMGETHDSSRSRPWSRPDRPEAPDGWHPPTIVEGPPGDVVQQHLQPIETVRRLEPASIDALDDGSFVLDFGEVLAGWVRLDVQAPPGTEIRLEHGEKRADDGSVPTEQSHFSVPFQTDTVIAGTAPVRWAPEFTYKGFRYVQISGVEEPPSPDAVVAEVAHNTIEAEWASSFECSDELLEQIQDNTRRALLSNHHGMPTDTPAYEKHGWTGDAQITAPTALYNFDMAALHRKFIDDMADAQRPSGELPPFVPTSDWGYSDEAFDEPFTAPLPAWDMAYVLMPWWLYRFRGDRRVLADHYEGMQSIVSFHRDYMSGGVLDEGLGDWFPPGHGEITWNPPEGPALTSTAYHCRALLVLRDVAEILGYEEDRQHYADLAEEAIEQFNEAFLDTTALIYRTGEVDEYRQTSNVFPLAFDLVPRAHRADVYAHLKSDVRDQHDSHLNTGILGTRFLLPVLSRFGDVDLAYEVATQRSYPSWGHWFDAGITGLCEAWEPEARSHNHHMFGSIGEWFYGYVCGIRPGGAGFNPVVIAPFPPTGLSQASATVETDRGDVAVGWERTDTGYKFDIRIPPTGSAAVALPGAEADVSESGTGQPPKTETDVAEMIDAHARLPTEDGIDRSSMGLPAGRWTVRTET